MFNAGVIVFREVFEIAIVVCVILAATRQVPGRGKYIAGGIGLGALSVAILAYFAEFIVGFAAHLGTHVFNAIVLFTAASLIAVSVVWMQQHGREIAAHMKALGASIATGAKPLYMLGIVVALAVLREGSEIVLFLYGVYASGESTVTDIIFGGLAGAALATMAGAFMYLGLIRIPVKQLFSVSGWLLAFLAAGMVAKGIGHLVQGGFLPGLINPIWDTSSILPQRELFGRFLSVLVGYQDQPAGIQVLFYVVTLILISFTMRANNHTK